MNTDILECRYGFFQELQSKYGKVKCKVSTIRGSSCAAACVVASCHLKLNRRGLSQLRPFHAAGVQGV
jgi:hypothetical protein